MRYIQFDAVLREVCRKCHGARDYNLHIPVSKREDCLFPSDYHEYQGGLYKPTLEVEYEGFSEAELAAITIEVPK